MTKKELESISNIEFAVLILQEKLNHVLQPTTPLAMKLQETIDELRQLAGG